MLYRPNQVSHSIKATLPHGYKAPVQTQHHHGILGILFSVIGFIVADIVVNLVVGFLAPAFLPVVDEALGSTEEGIIGAEIGAEGITDAVGDSGNFVTRGIRKGIRFASKHVGKRFRQAKDLFQKPSQAFWGKVITTPLGRGLYTFGRVALKNTLKLLAYQTSSGINYQDGKFEYNKNIWKNASSWGFNALFAFASMVKLGKLALGKVFLNSFQNFLKIAGKGSDLLKPYEEIMKMMDIKAKFHNQEFGLGDFLNLINLDVGDTDFLAKSKWFFSDYEINLIREFHMKLVSNTLKDEERRFYKFKFWGFYLKIHDSLHKVAQLKVIARIKDIFWSPITKSIDLDRSQVWIAFDHWWKKYHTEYFSKQIVELDSAVILGQEKYDYIFQKFLKQNGIYEHYAGKFGGSSRWSKYFQAPKKKYTFLVTKGVFGKFLSRFDKLESYFGLTKDTFLETRNGFKDMLRRVYIKSTAASGVHILDTFESIVFQYLTSPLYALERIPYIISKNLVRATKKLKFFDDLYNDRFFQYQVNKYLDPTIDFKKFNKYEKRSFYKVRDTAYRYYTDRIDFLEYRDILYKDREIDIFDGVLGKIIGKTNLKIDRYLEELGLVKNNESILEKLRTNADFIEFKRSSILGVRIHGFTNGNGNDFTGINGGKEANFSSEEKFAVLSENKSFASSKYTWTIFFASYLRKQPVTQYDVRGSLVKNFVSCGLFGRPREPWPYYNRYIAFGKSFTSFLKGGFSLLGVMDPEKAALVRYYGLDFYSGSEAFAGKTDYYKLSKSFHGGTSYEKIVLYTQIRLALGAAGRFRGVSRLQTTRFTGLLAGSIINVQQKRAIQTGKFGKRVGKLAYYRSGKVSSGFKREYNI